MRFLYDFFLRLYKLGIVLASPFNVKARKWLKGRQQVFERLARFAQDHPKNIWVHCASVGEFEQGFPIIQTLEKEYPEYQVLISFFSPSGYDFIADKYPNFKIFYLPLDTKKNAKKWVQILSPKAAFFVKYEFWHHYFYTLSEKNIPLFMVSAVFWKDLFFFKRYGTFFRQALRKVTHFFVQDLESQQLLGNIGITNTTIAGDARFDRVLQIKKEAYSDARIESFLSSKNVFIAGSVWNDDIAVLHEIIERLPSDFKIIIAPHEIARFDYHKFSDFTSERFTAEPKIGSKILFLDTLGILSKIYRFATLVYIGGGFGKGIHNVLEPAVYNTPIIIGPNYEQFIEAKELEQIGLLHILEHKIDVNKVMKHALDIKPSVIRQNKAFFAKNANVSEQIIVFIKKHAFLD